MDCRGAAGRSRREHLGRAARGRHEVHGAVDGRKIVDDALHQEGLPRARIAAKYEDPRFVVVKKRLKLRNERGLTGGEPHAFEHARERRILDVDSARLVRVRLFGRSACIARVRRRALNPGARDAKALAVLVLKPDPAVVCFGRGRSGGDGALRRTDERNVSFGRLRMRHDGLASQALRSASPLETACGGKATRTTVFLVLYSEEP